MRTEPPDLVTQVLAGAPRAVARAITLAEQGGPAARALIARLYGHATAAGVVGVTGPPGVGKSTLVDRLAGEWRREGRRVAILAVDPTSPFTGGAILGDRIRMRDHVGDEGVFLRSMATRGRLGGLAPATADAVVVVTAAGADVVLVETVGVGQGEVDVARTADVAVVVTVPGTGDDVQALKAGIMEIADIFVVNKADRPGADQAVAQIKGALDLGPATERSGVPPVMKTAATTGAGVRELFEAIGAGLANGRRREHRRLARAEVRVHEALTVRMFERLETDAAARAALTAAVERVARMEVDPYTAADEVMEQMR